MMLDNKSEEKCVVQAGESIALAGDQPIWFELWQNGQAINPEEVIAF